MMQDRACAPLEQKSGPAGAAVLEFSAAGVGVHASGLMSHITGGGGVAAVEVAPTHFIARRVLPGGRVTRAFDGETCARAVLWGGAAAVPPPFYSGGGDVMDDRERMLRMQANQSWQAHQAADDIDALQRDRDAEKLRGAGVIFLLAVGIVAFAVFAVPAAVWFLS
jgi:hypothetical protein